MRKHSNGNGKSADQCDEIEFVAIIKICRKYWWGYVLAGGLCALVSFGYYHRTLPPPESHLRLELGFNSISSGRYPDGSLFNKSDFISDAVLRTAYEKLEGRLVPKMWTPNQFAGFFSVEGIYPIELQLLKSQLQAKNNGMKAEEVAAGYAKLLKFVPVQYDISFVPPSTVSDELRSQVLGSIVKNYSTIAAKDHMMLLWKNERPTEVSKENTSGIQAMYFLERKTKDLEQLISMVNAGMFSNTVGEGASDKVAYEEMTRGRTQSTRLSFQSSLSHIKSELLSLDVLLFDQKAVEDIVGSKRDIEGKLTELLSQEELLDKQEQFRLSLTKRPGNIISDKVEGQDSDIVQGNESFGLKPSKSIMGMMLTYNEQYYSLLKEAKMLNDQRLMVLAEIKTLQKRLDRLNSPTPKVPGDGKALFRKVDEKLTNISGLIDQLSSDVVQEGNNILMSTEPPVRNFFISHQHHRIPLKWVLAIGFAIMILAASLHVAYLLHGDDLIASRRDEVRGDEAYKFGSKIAGKN